MLEKKGSEHNDPRFRLNRYIAMCGLGSRRSADGLIRSGRVAVNGTEIRDLSLRVSPERDEVRVDNVPIFLKDKCYLVMNKPCGVVCAVADKYYRTVIDILPGYLSGAGVFPAGRLDRDSEGLLLLTNDGKIAQMITHPRNEILKTYEILVDRPVTPEDVDSLGKGVFSGSKLLIPRKIIMMPRKPPGRWLSIILSEGIKREIRLMAASRGFKVLRLVRRKIGNLELQKLPPGEVLQVKCETLINMILSGGKV